MTDSQPKIKLKFKCEDCNATFTTDSQLRRHSKQHFGKKCPFCHNSFTNKYSLQSHVKLYHDSAPPLIYRCLQCGKTYKRKYTLEMHLKSHGPDDSKIQCEMCGVTYSTIYVLKAHKAKGCPKANIKECPICHEKDTKAKIIHHFKIKHDIVVYNENLSFTNYDKFNYWKEEMEKNTKSRFIAIRKNKNKKDSVTTLYFECHRSGYFVPKGKGIKHNKRMGSNKIHGYCPALLTVKVGDQVDINFVNTHVGHGCDVSRLTLTRNERLAIASKIASKIPFNDILNEIRNSHSGDDVERINLITRKDLFNIEAEFNLKCDSVRRSNDQIPKNSNSKDQKVPKKPKPCEEGNEIDLSLHPVVITGAEHWLVPTSPISHVSDEFDVNALQVHESGNHHEDNIMLGEVSKQDSLQMCEALEIQKENLRQEFETIMEYIRSEEELDVLRKQLYAARPLIDGRNIVSTICSITTGSLPIPPLIYFTEKIDSNDDNFMIISKPQQENT